MIYLSLGFQNLRRNGLGNINRFEDLPVWKAAAELAVGVYDLTSSSSWTHKASLKNQLERAALSVSNNIAEGFERQSKNDLVHFLYIANGSAAEVRSMLTIIEHLSEFSNLKSQISNLRLNAEMCSKQLVGWAQYLVDSDIKGKRHLTTETRTANERKSEREEFRAELQRLVEEGRR